MKAAIVRFSLAMTTIGLMTGTATAESLGVEALPTEFGSFTDNVGQTRPPFNYVSNDGNNVSVLGANEDPGTLVIFGMMNTTFQGVQLSFTDVTTSPVTIDSATNLATQAFTSDSNSILNIVAAGGNAILTLSGFTGSLTGTLGSSTATFNGQLTVNSTNDQPSLLGFSSGSLVSFSLGH